MVRVEALILSHVYICNTEHRSLFFLWQLHTLIIFNIANNIRVGRIIIGCTLIVDDHTLCRCKLAGLCRLCLRLLLLFFLLRPNKLLERSLDVNLSSLPLLWHWLRTLLKQMYRSTLRLCRHIKRKFMISETERHLHEMKGTAFKASHQLSDTSMASLAMASFDTEFRCSFACLIICST